MRFGKGKVWVWGFFFSSGFWDGLGFAAILAVGLADGLLAFYTAISMALTFLGFAFKVGAMESLHAPWRIEYVLSPKPAAGEESLFARIARSEDDVGNLVVHRDRHCFVLLNRYPYNGGHLMVAPYKEVADLDDLEETALAELTLVTRRCVRALRAVMKPDGFNVGLNLGRAAGAGIEGHLHFHVVPRWNGDTNFMPVIANSRVIPEALLETAAKLRAAFPQHG